jgi:hypothetical protein
MENTKIRVKIGNNEFEAEGPTDLVKEQFEAFKQIISLTQAKTPVEQMAETAKSIANQFAADGIPLLRLETIMNVNGRIVSLTALPQTSEDAALLIMLGHSDLKNSASVTAQEIGDGLAQSGRPVPRVDRVMESALEHALVLKTGVKRSTRYRLTNQGMVQARKLAAELLATLP